MSEHTVAVVGTIPTDTLREALPGRTDGLMDHFRFSAVFGNSKARSDLRFEQTVGREVGVRRTVSWPDERGRIDDWESDPEYGRVVEAWRDAESSRFPDARSAEAHYRPRTSSRTCESAFGSPLPSARSHRRRNSPRLIQKILFSSGDRFRSQWIRSTCVRTT